MLFSEVQLPSHSCQIATGVQGQLHPASPQSGASTELSESPAKPGGAADGPRILRDHKPSPIRLSGP